MSPIMRRVFWFFNKFFVAPMFRLGFGPFFGNPLTGYIMVMKIIGRKSGQVHYVPVNYAIKGGNVYCVSAGRKRSDWFRNLIATPEIELIMPGGAIYARAEEVADLDEKRTTARQILKNAGFAGFFEGYNPYRISDEKLQAKVADLPVLRFQTLGIGNGASDPAGWVWISVLLIAITIIWA
jgi:deazaflavin-dependent oxidoreductase (nitroreductase family)